MVLVRTLTKKTFGDYQFVLTAVALSSIFCFSGLQNVTLQSVARGFSGTYRAATKWSWFGSFGGTVCLIICGLVFWYIGEHELTLAFLCAAIVFPVSSGLVTWMPFLAGKENFRLQAVAMGSTLAAGNGIIIILGLAKVAPLWLLVVVSLGSVGLLNIWMTRRSFLVTCSSGEIEPNSIAYGLRTSMYSVANVVGNYLDRVLLYLLISPESLAIFAISERIPELLKKNIQSFTEAIIPTMSRKESYTASMDAKINKSGVMASAVILILAFAVIPWLLPLLYTEGFQESVVFCQMLLVSMCIGMFATLKFSYIKAKMDERSFRDITLGISGARILFSVLLVPSLGLLGAALSSIAYRCVTFSLVSYYIKRYHSSEQIKEGSS